MEKPNKANPETRYLFHTIKGEGRDLGAEGKRDS